MSQRDDDRFRVRPGAPKQRGDAFVNKVLRQANKAGAKLGNDDVEPLEHGRVPVGRIVFETLSAALDPYPRKEGAEFEWRDKKDGGQDQAPRPFDILSRLKDKR